SAAETSLLEEWSPIIGSKVIVISLLLRGRLTGRKGTPADQPSPQHRAGHVTGYQGISDPNQKLRGRGVVHRSGTSDRQREGFYRASASISPRSASQITVSSVRNVIARRAPSRRKSSRSCMKNPSNAKLRGIAPREITRKIV